MEPSDHDILIELRTELRELVKKYDEHNQTHKQYTYLLWSLTIGLIISFMV